MSWQTIIRHYRMRHLPNHIAEVQWFSNQPTLDHAIEKAALAENHLCKRYDHQRRIPRRALEMALRELRTRENSIRQCASFDQLCELIENALKNIVGIGELYCYDAALRIGAKLDLHPQSILLHAGTRQGASFIKDISGLRSLSRGDLPLELRHLPAEQVEDILCIYKTEIENLCNE